MDIRKVKKLIEMLEESAISEIEIHEGEESVRISRHSSAVPSQTVVHVPTMGMSTGAAPVASAETVAKEPELDGHVIKAPMVGIFYEAPSPGKAPFVQQGESVKAGDVLCILEAMKIMNQIEADVSGVVAKVLVANGEPVEYGQPLFLIRPA